MFCVGGHLGGFYMIKKGFQATFQSQWLPDESNSGYVCGTALCIACNACIAWGLISQKLVLTEPSNGNMSTFRPYTQPRWIAGVVVMIVA